jgi:heat shock protein HslJ
LQRSYKDFMKILLALGLVSGFILSCSTSKNSTTQNLNGNWELSVFPTTDKTFDEVFSQGKPQLQFDHSKGTVSGTTGCNRLSGSYSAGANNFSFGSNMITTKMACPGYEESVFLNALYRVNRYKVNGNQLTFLHDSTLVMTFVRKL